MILVPAGLGPLFPLQTCGQRMVQSKRQRGLTTARLPTEPATDCKERIDRADSELGV